MSEEIVPRSEPLLKRLFSRWRKAPAAPNETTVAVTTELANLGRNLRRLSMANDQQTDLLKGVNKQLGDFYQFSLQQALAQRQQVDGINIGDKDLLACLDDLDKVLLVTNETSIQRPLLIQLKTRLLSAAEWQPLAELGRPLGHDHHRIVEVMSDSDIDAGSVARIIQQGYIQRGGAVLREAAVVVAGLNSSQNPN